MNKKILTVFGTRPEAIKLAPVLVALERQPAIQSRICVTAQHRQMLDQMLALFAITPQIDLDLMQPGQTLAEINARVLLAMDRTLQEERPHVVIIQGDTTSAMAAALAAFYRGVTVAHVEAGLRSGDISSPFPEEMNRRVATQVSALHFAPTRQAQAALLAEGVAPTRIFLTGNPVIDAVRLISERPPSPQTAALLEHVTTINGSTRTPSALVLVTAHRRENFGERLLSICQGCRSLVERNKEVVLLLPVHPNPQVQATVHAQLGQVERIHLTTPLDYDTWVHLMKASRFILTDSGGVQEEAPALGKPVLVMRTETERPEGLIAGTARLVGPNAETILQESERLLHDPTAYEQMAQACNPYGDGYAAARIARVLCGAVHGEEGVEWTDAKGVPADTPAAT